MQSKPWCRIVRVTPGYTLDYLSSLGAKDVQMIQADTDLICIHLQNTEVQSGKSTDEIICKKLLNHLLRSKCKFITRRELARFLETPAIFKDAWTHLCS